MSRVQSRESERLTFIGLIQPLALLCFVFGLGCTIRRLVMFSTEARLQLKVGFTPLNYICWVTRARPYILKRRKPRKCFEFTIRQCADLLPLNLEVGQLHWVEPRLKWRKAQKVSRVHGIACSSSRGIFILWEHFNPRNFPKQIMESALYDSIITFLSAELILIIAYNLKKKNSTNEAIFWKI